jgi:hypothetical protein
LNIFGTKCCRTSNSGMKHLLGVIIGSHQDHTGWQPLGSDFMCNLLAIHSGQIDIYHGNARAQGHDKFQALLTVSSLSNHLKHGVYGQSISDSLPKEGMIINNDNAYEFHFLSPVVCF